MSEVEAALPRLQIQTVLYKTPPATLERFLRSVANAAGVAKALGRISEVTLFVGDCSPLRMFTDDGIPVVLSWFGVNTVDRFEYEFFDANLGSAGGHNRLFGKTDSELVLVLNPDAVVSPDMIAELEMRTRHPQVGLVEGRQLPLEHPKYYDPATGETSWASGACMMLLRQVLDQTGGFDSESFFMYCDDVDLSWRVRLAGYKVVLQPSARIFHDKRLDLKGCMVTSTAEEYYSAEAALILTYKWSRQDLTELYLDQLKKGTPLQREAAAAFTARLEAGKLPETLDHEHLVGQFDETGRWAEHRW